MNEIEQDPSVLENTRKYGIFGLVLARKDTVFERPED